MKQNKPCDNLISKCLICEKPVPDYIPEFCCDGPDCACYGRPIHPCVCSDECEAALLNHIGKSFEERRILAKIAKYDG